MASPAASPSVDSGNNNDDTDNADNSGNQTAIGFEGFDLYAQDDFHRESVRLARIEAEASARWPLTSPPR